nr:MAG TPA: hypothetical protein [Caudoviricetes sp.]
MDLPRRIRDRPGVGAPDPAGVRAPDSGKGTGR